MTQKNNITNNIDQNTFKYSMKIDKKLRSHIKNQNPFIIWITGLSGAGKSTIADHLEKKLNDLEKHTYLLDGDNLRYNLNKDLGFTDDDRIENIRRVAEVGKLMVDAGLIVIASLISPFNHQRKLARELFDLNEFVEVFVNTPLNICEKRDPKGLYKKARSGKLKNFTGIDSIYEKPESCEIVIDGSIGSPDELAEKIIKFIKIK